MKVTRVNLRTDLVEKTGSRLVAMASVTFDDSLLIRGVRVIKTLDGRLLVCMPERRDNQGQWHDTVHPTTPELRAHLNSAVLDALAGQRALDTVSPE